MTRAWDNLARSQRMEQIHHCGDSWELGEIDGQYLMEIPD